MAYDLAFWAGPRTDGAAPESIYMDLISGHEVPGLETFATASVLSALAVEFPGLGDASLETGQAFWESTPPGSVFEFSWSHQHLVATARGQFSNEQMNTIIDICVEVGGGRLYDPQTNERFDSQ